MSVEFLDTNILVYAFDRLAGPRHDAAKALFQRITRDGTDIRSRESLGRLSKWGHLRRWRVPRSASPADRGEFVAEPRIPLSRKNREE